MKRVLFPLGIFVFSVVAVFTFVSQVETRTTVSTASAANGADGPVFSYQGSQLPIYNTS